MHKKAPVVYPVYHHHIVSLWQQVIRTSRRRRRRRAGDWSSHSATSVAPPKNPAAAAAAPPEQPIISSFKEKKRSHLSTIHSGFPCCGRQHLHSQYHVHSQSAMAFWSTCCALQAARRCSRLGRAERCGPTGAERLLYTSLCTISARRLSFLVDSDVYRTIPRGKSYRFERRFICVPFFRGSPRRRVRTGGRGGGSGRGRGDVESGTC